MRYNGFTTALVEDLVEVPWDDTYTDNSEAMQMLHPDSREFIVEVKKALRGCKIGREKDAHTPLRHVFVYYDDCPLAVGRISYGMHNKTTEAEVYMVGSRSVKNRRYNDYDDQHHMVLTKNLHTAVKAACRYLRPWSTTETANFLWANMTDDVQGRGQRIRNLWFKGAKDLKSIVADAQHLVSKTETVVRELESLYEQGHTFTNPEVTKLMESYSRARKVLAEDVAERQGGAAFIHMGEETCSIARLSEVDKYGPDIWSLADVQVRDVNSLPDELSSRLAPLTMFSAGNFVDRVGARITERCFFVYTD